MESKIKLTPKQKDIISKMRLNPDLHIIEESFWGVKFSFLGQTIPFDRALKFIHNYDLFYKTKRVGDVHYFSLTDLGKTIQL